MSITLVRKESDTPNINNTDDVRGFKYGGLGVNGVVKGYLNECQATASSNSLQIGSGEIILDGWQVDLDASGVTITASNISGLQYYTVYLEVDLSISDNKTASIKATMDSYSYPTINRGDDISVVDTGIGRLPLYTFEANGGTISNVQSVFEILDGETHKAKYAEYASEDTSKGTIEERLTRLGFREGVVEYLVATASTNFLKRQGNYVIGTLDLGNNRFYYHKDGNIVIGVLPTEFRPKQDEYAFVPFKEANFIVTNTQESYYYGVLQIKISTSGAITLHDFICGGHYVWVQINQSTHAYLKGNATSITLSNLSGTMIYGLKIQFGYEAKPLE